MEWSKERGGWGRKEGGCKGKGGTGIEREWRKGKGRKKEGRKG